MNARLRTQPDGTEGFFYVARVTTGGQQLQPMPVWGRIYWPFALADDLSSIRRPRYDITHLPTGCAVVRGVPARTAHALIRRLRALPMSWDFTATRIPRAVRQLAAPIVQSMTERRRRA